MENGDFPPSRPPGGRGARLPPPPPPLVGTAMAAGGAAGSWAVDSLRYTPRPSSTRFLRFSPGAIL